MYNMHILLMALLATSISIVCGEQKVVLANFKHKRHYSKRSLNERDASNDFNVTLIPDGGQYLVNVTIGTPPQPVYLALDLLAADIWMMGEVLCSNSPNLCDGGYFNVTKSSTYESHGTDNFQLEYIEAVGIGNGSYFLDTISIGNLRVQKQQMAVAIAQDEDFYFGSLGLGQPYSQASNRLDGVTYPSLLDQMVQQGVIHRRAFSLYTDNSITGAGSVIFGGIDTEKYIGDLVHLPVQTIDNQVTNPYAWHLVLSSLSIHNKTSSHHFTLPTDSEAEINSIVVFTYLPVDVIKEVAKDVGAYYSSTEQLWLINCSHLEDFSTYISFGLGTKESGIAVVNISIADLTVQTTDHVGNPLYCAFGLQNHMDNEVGNPKPNQFAFGLTFISSVYMLFDLDTQTVGMAQAILNVNTSNIQELLPLTTTMTTTAIPSPTTLTQVTESVSVTASAVVTATIRNGGRSVYCSTWYHLLWSFLPMLLLQIIV